MISSSREELKEEEEKSMSCLSMMEARLPPGFRFHPRDDELICDYLAKKMAGDNGRPPRGGCAAMIVDVDLNKCEPWELPETACVGGKEWYFFNLRDRKYTTGQRTNRATVSGYWKATGKDRPVSRRGVLVGMRKTLVFYQGRAPKGSKTDWVMHEFRMQVSPHPSHFISNFKEDWVLCRVTFKRRAAIARTDSDNCQDDTSSSSFPSLKNAHMPFDQMPLSLEGYEQVPCFSNLSADGAAAPSVGSQDPSFYDNNKFSKTSSSFNHFTKLVGYSKKEHPFPDTTQGNLESFFCENGMPSHIWNA